MLTERVPDSLSIAGTRYPINTDYRVWIKFEKLLTESDGNDDETLDAVLRLLFSERIPPRIYVQETIDSILWFYKCGKEIGHKGSSSKNDVFSYDFDDGYIVAAFKQQYDIDLNDEDMHWWKFHAYMLALPENTEFVKIMGYRAMDISSKMSATQRNFYQKMKQHYKLPVKKELQKKYDQLEEALLNGESIDGLI